MGKRNLSSEFWGLIQSIQLLRPEWQLRCVGIGREQTLRGGAFPGLLHFSAQLMPFREGYGFSLRHRRKGSERRFKRLLVKAGWSRAKKLPEDGTRFEPLPISKLDAIWEGLSHLCSAGEAVRRDRRPSRKVIPRRIHVLNQARGWLLIEWLGRRAESGWRPELLFLRHERRIRSRGVDWIVDCDGYWEPSWRKGLELDVIVTSARPMSSRVWRRLKTEGFAEQCRRDLQNLGLRPCLRPRLGSEDFEGTSGGPYLASFEGRIRLPDRRLQSVRELMTWKPD